MPFRTIWKSSPKFRIGVIIFMTLVIAAVFHQLIITWYLGPDVNVPEAGSSGAIFQDPSWKHPLGTDRFGRDWLGMILVSLPVSLTVSVLAAIISVTLGSTVGFVAGFKGGKIDTVLRMLTDILIVVPTFPLIMVLAAYARALSTVELALAISIFAWATSARVIRTQVLSLRERPYIELSRMTNMSDREIIIQDILPNMIPYLGINLAQATISSAFALVGLTVLGLAPRGLTDLGALVNLSLSWAVLSLGNWWIFAAPVAVLTALFFGLAMVNMGMEEFYNPRLRGTS
ncbi:MAG TPA: ABC transporter permease [Thermomicrobiales bacterium]|jgi:peptide/nickel transport system permease protein|nr:ABC transporter permease [Thermomicrobiales bacterium]